MKMRDKSMMEALKDSSEEVKARTLPVIKMANLWTSAQTVLGFGKHEESVRIAMRDAWIVGYLHGAKRAGKK